MAILDSTFASLVDAWRPVLAARAVQATAPITNCSSCGSGWSSQAQFAWAPDAETRHDRAVGVVVAAQPGTAAGRVADVATSSLLEQLVGCRAFRAYLVRPSSGIELGTELRLRRPRLLLIDLALADALGSKALQHARRVSLGTDWVVLWDESTSHGFELALACHARGCIDWQSPTDRLMQALRAILGGQLWFPRRAMESLYHSLLEAAEPESTAAPELDLEAVASHRSLSAREFEVLALIRQGLSNQQIADRLRISVNTVKKHLAHAYEKRGLHQRRQLVG